ncbi:MAG TPA: pyridoxal-dependent decarboxylase [Longimicrobiaceae bacterium]|nr:pyridoxal-dependent decarboxylase [Longimicrobiaceae bacterium]
MPHDPLDPALADAEALRTAGHRLVDRMADYLAGVGSLPVSTPLQPREIAARFAEPLPVDGRPAEEVWDEAWTHVVPDAIHLAHPMYMGHQVAPPLPHAVLADAMASLLNQSLAVWEMSPTGTMVEAQVIRWFVELLGWPAGADGTLVSGGSVANLTGLLAAREARFPGCWRHGVAATDDARRAVLLVSGHSHYSVERTAGLLGLGSDAVVSIPETAGRMDPGALERSIAALRAEGRIPFAVSATSGSTATGLFDPLDAIADVCARHGVWMHVDAAHGGSFLLSGTLRGLLAGIERADSVAWDPHKMMWMPMSVGAVLVRDRRHLDAAFQQKAPYLFHPRPGEERSGDTGQRTLQCSRRFDALKVWICLRHYGTAHFGALIDGTVHNTRHLHALLAAAPDFEPLHEVHGNILCFRHLPAGIGEDAGTADAFQAAVRERWNASGRGWITSTLLDGRRVLRVTLINPHTTEAHVAALVDGLREMGREILAAG